ncbi:MULTISPECIES: hypothetical protein [unclassified Nocardioides]|uniref:hypothetical protein n=1 Tax=unclassified Nocardioides TaxID=2615069 RepID=UPI0006F88B8D|nr:MULTISPECIES: hypothetical protein [unclassified Nocardioides]KRA30077.1 hypothetical protein ASD81_20540 [Nocardioides sp. Root614]KRA86997.1 hypothetical protein ASD84_22755 [Nocardioides sp. Root682]
MRIDWIPTKAELDAFIRAMGLDFLKRTALVVLIVWAGGALVVSPYGIAAVIFYLAAMGVLAIVIGVVIHRRIRRMGLGAYPVGQVASAEAQDTGLRLVSAAGAAEIPWSRMTRTRVGPVMVTFKDALSRQTMMVPRQLMPDEWLTRLDPPRS